MLSKNDINKLEIKKRNPDITALGCTEYSADDRITNDSAGDSFGLTITRLENSPIEMQDISREFEILYVHSGKMRLTVSEKKYILSDGATAVIAPGVSYSYDKTETASVVDITVCRSFFNEELYKAVLYNSALSSFLARAAWGDTYNDCFISAKFTDKYLYEILEMLVTEYQFRGEFSRMKMTNLLITAIGYMSDSGSDEFSITGKVIKKYDQLPRILEYIDNNFRTVTLEELAGHFHYTVPYVSKLIKTSTGLTFTDIISRKKFEMCRSLLTTTDLKINKIAELAGYQNTDHFNRSFKKRVGITPSDYKKKLS